MWSSAYIDFCQFFGGEALKVYKRNQHRPANQSIIELEQSGKTPKAMRLFTLFVLFSARYMQGM